MISRPEEPLAAVVDVVHVLVQNRCPSPLRAASRILGESITEPSAIWKNPGRSRGCRIGERDRLLRRQRVAATLGVVLDETARGLGVQPLADVAFGGRGALGKLGGRQPAPLRQVPGTGRACRRSRPALRSRSRRLRRRRERRTASTCRRRLRRLAQLCSRCRSSVRFWASLRVCSPSAYTTSRWTLGLQRSPPVIRPATRPDIRRLMGWALAKTPTTQRSFPSPTGQVSDRTDRGSSLPKTRRVP